MMFKKVYFLFMGLCLCYFFGGVGLAIAPADTGLMARRCQLIKSADDRLLTCADSQGKLDKCLLRLKLKDKKSPVFCLSSKKSLRHSVVIAVKDERFLRLNNKDLSKGKISLNSLKKRGTMKEIRSNSLQLKGLGELIANVVKSVAHGIATVASGVWQAITVAFSSVGHFLNDVFRPDHSQVGGSASNNTNSTGGEDASSTGGEDASPIYTYTCKDPSAISLGNQTFKCSCPGNVIIDKLQSCPINSNNYTCSDTNARPRYTDDFTCVCPDGEVIDKRHACSKQGSWGCPFGEGYDYYDQQNNRYCGCPHGSMEVVNGSCVTACPVGFERDGFGNCQSYT